jgi:hypothetical protein
MAKTKTVRAIEEIKDLMRWAESTIEYHGKEVIRLAPKVGMYAERGDVKGSADIAKRIVSEYKTIEKAKKEIKELKEELKEAEIQESKNSNDPIDQFLALWRAEATKYYTDLRAKYLELRAGADKEELKKFNKDVTKNDKNIIVSMSDKTFLEKILDQEVVAKKKAFVAKVEEKAGKIQDLKKLYVAGDGSINGFATGSERTVEVETILAGGYNIQKLHYRVLVK